MRVLVVDDEFQLAVLAAEVLETLSHEALVVGCAEHALEVAREERFDLLLTDLNLPGLNGEKLIERLRRTQPGLPVVLSTGHELTETELLALARSGAPVALLKKPWGEDSLSEAIRSAPSMVLGAR